MLMISEHFKNDPHLLGASGNDATNPRN